jgi:serine/threonine protein kinase
MTEEASSETEKRREASIEPAPATPRSPGAPAPSPAGGADDAPAPGDGGDTAPVSIRSLATAPVEPTPPSMSARDREALAKKRVGSTMKGWRLARLLGTGPVCAAYESFRGADDSGEHVVLRVMVGNIATHERARAMLLRGAYASNRFNHPRVIPVIGDGTDEGGTPFVVRPWIDAETLDQTLGKMEGPLTEAQVLRIAEQVLDALEIAHSHGIVHGAITSRNILVTPRGSVRLCDFSVPPGMGPRTSDDVDVLAQRRIGPFSAPERCGDEPGPASEQSDIYMLAACMYYAIARENPRGKVEGSADLARTPARPVRQVAPKVSEYFAMVVDHALSLEPEARFESAYAMLGDVRRVMAGRKPKLGDARKPVPSGSFSAIPLSSRDGSPSSQRASMLRGDLLPLSATHSRRAAGAQWRGNMALILAIALLVGVATFVMVREKVEENRAQEQEELLKKQQLQLQKKEQQTPPALPPSPAPPAPSSAP